MKLLFLCICALFLLSCSDRGEDLPPPNILWITSEDNSPLLGCYGDAFATTPNLDALAARGFRYTHAFANAPVCAPSRNTMITGVYANANGHQHMRSRYPKSDAVELYPRLLRKAGYYTTNNVKEDFNIDPEQTKDVWDERSREAHYRNRPAGKPFFAIFNCTISHESSIHDSIPSEKLRHKPEDVTLPPYHPDTRALRHDWAQYYDKVEDMDAWVGNILRELEESGEAENTIVFYFSDHGGVLGRSKRFLYETGTHVPFIVYIPEKYKHLYPADEPGDVVDRMISFVDLAPTLMSLTRQPIPGYMQGNAFLGEQKTTDPEYAFMFRDRMDERYDMSRSVRDKRFRYIRNYMPHREHGQHLPYLWRAPSMVSWEEACRAGKCSDVQMAFWNPKSAEELYDVEEDPWEINNLANDPKYADVLARMRGALREWMVRIRDTGFIPEAEMIQQCAGQAPYDHMRNTAADLGALIDVADAATRPTANDLDRLQTWLRSGNAPTRYWAATGLCILGEQARPALPQLRAALADPSPNVAIAAAEALYKLGDVETARASLLRALKHENPFVRTHALNVLAVLKEDSSEVRHAVRAIVEGQSTENQQAYDWRMGQALMEKWK